MLLKGFIEYLLKINNLHFLACYLQAAVWLRYAECLNSLGELRAAARAYEQVVTLAPTHMEARVLLSALKQQLGEHEEALRVLETGTYTERA